MNHASGVVTPSSVETVLVAGAVGQRAERRGLLQVSVRPVRLQKSSVICQENGTRVLPRLGLMAERDCIGWAGEPPIADSALRAVLWET
jgi:hypothetical protein